MIREPISIYLKVVIDETIRNRTDEDATRVYTLEEKFRTIEEVKDFMVERYGRIPGGRKKIYRDTPNGAVVVGFLHTFWNRDTPGEKAYLQTDWVSVTEVHEYLQAI